jgi:ABC-2 type transport system ATP-binding protein
MRQRLGVAVALLGDPQVLILDEPANGLDPEGIRWMRNLLRTLAAHGRTVLLSSHLLAEMKLLADDLIIIAAGQLAAQDTDPDPGPARRLEAAAVGGRPDHRPVPP